MAMPAVAGSASAAPPVTSQAQDPMQGADSGDLTAFAGQLRQVSQSVDEISTQNPDIAPIMQKIKGLLRDAIVAKAQAASMQTPSAQALPMAGS